MAFLKRDENAIRESENTTKTVTNINSAEVFLVRWFFESSTDNSRVYWKAISSTPEVKSTSELYLGSIPFDETRNLKIEGLNRNNAADVQIEIKVVCPGYKTITKRFNALQVINQQEISWFFELYKNED